MTSKTIFSGLFAFALVAIAATFAIAGPGNGAKDSKASANTIRVLEHAGYFETHGNVFQIDAGTYTFEVENRSGKDAGFVLLRKGGEPQAVMIKDGHNGTLKAKLEPGEYTYFCPIIPTASYPLTVK